MSPKVSLKKVYVVTAISAILGYFLYQIIPQLNNNLWNDEFITILSFILVPFKTTLTNYHTSNNHILFSIFSHFYLQALGITSSTYTLENPWILRLPMLFVSIATLLMMYKTGKMIGGRSVGLLSMAILATTIPFHNFCLQLRGYPFSMFFDTLIIYSIASYFKEGRKKYLILLAISIWLTFYTIPSNLYCIVAISAFLSGELIYNCIKERAIDSRFWKPLIAVVIGMILALICFSPVLERVFTNDYVRATFHPSRIIDATFFYGDLIWGRRLLFILFGVSAFIYFIPIMPSQANVTLLWRMVYWQFIIPVIIVVIAGQHPPPRIFVYLFIFMAPLIAVNINYLLRLLIQSRYRSTIIALMILYLLIASHINKTTLDHEMSENIRQGILTENLLYNYYLYHYTPLAVAHYLKEREKQEPQPVILKPDDMCYYLTALNTTYHRRDSTDYFLSQGKKVIYVTTYRLEQRLADQYHCTVREILPSSKEILQPSYHHVLELERP